MSDKTLSNEELFELRVLFFRELKDGYLQARESQEKFLKDPSDGAAIRNLADFFHRIAGTAQTVGLSLLGYTASITERVCRLVLDGECGDRAGIALLLSEALAGVAATLDEHGNGATERPLTRATDFHGMTLPEAVGEGRELSKVLVVDDDEFSAGFIDSCLRQAGFMSSYCCSPRDALKLIEAELPDLIIMDVVMPEIDGFELCRRVREHPALLFTPIIFVTRKGEVEQRVRGLEVGGNDYIAKPFEPQELVARVRSHLERLAALREMAVRDGLTRCFNHKYLRARLMQEIGRSRRYEQPLALAMLDADNFKSINDEYGHRAGDMVLAHLAGIVMASVRATDVVARYGGEEFAVLMVQAGVKEAEIVCNRLRERISAHRFSYTLDKGETQEVAIPLTVSIGIAELLPGGETLEGLLERSDNALYAAKKAGRNCVHVAASE
jgi:diguanylate cyclase (GGDEF)-like protein